MQSQSQSVDADHQRIGEDIASSVLLDLEFLQALVILLHVYTLLLLKPFRV